MYLVYSQLQRGTSSRPVHSSSTHHLSFLLELLQVLGEVDANVHHHVLGNQLSLPRVVVHLVQHFQKRLVAGKPTIQVEERGEERVEK